MQKLILPINQMRITASYKAIAYRERFGFTHYGFDAVSKNGNTAIYASGAGQVLSVGNDSVVGNMVIVRYTDVLNHKTGKSADIIMRYFHLSEICVGANELVTKDTKLGNYGNSGKYSTGAHLHFECDSDVSTPTYTSTLRGSSSLLRASTTDTSVDPAVILFIKASPPDNQEVILDKSSYKGSPYVLSTCGQLPSWEA